jgi:serine/threonine protein phosphatase PrpC
MEYQSALKNFSGNYITAIPEIKVFELNHKHKSIILASDGLWDKLGRQEVAEIFRKTPLKEIPNLLINKCLQKAADETKLTVK